MSYEQQVKYKQQPQREQLLQLLPYKEWQATKITHYNEHKLNKLVELYNLKAIVCAKATARARTTAKAQLELQAKASA